MLSLFILIPLACILVLNLPLVRWIRPASVWIALLISLAQIYYALCPGNVYFGYSIDVDSLLSLGLSLDNFGRLLLLIVGIVVFTAVLVGNSSFKETDRKFRFVHLIFISMIGMNGLIMLTDLFSMYLFIEITAISSYILIVLDKENDALEGSFKYILLSALATVFMLASISLIIMMTGNASFAVVKAALSSGEPNLMLRIAIIIFICGLLIKGGLIPFHWWLPDAYSSAPAPVSILLAGIVTKICGIYSLMRVVSSVFGYSPQTREILMAVGCISIVAGALLALGQSDFKRMLAYSSISQMGYIILGFGCGTPLAVAGAAFHFFNHSVFKSLLFVNSAAVEEITGTRDMDNLGGLGERMKITNATSLIGFLSAAGVPPLAGFWSKLIIIIALWNSGDFAYSVIAVLAGVLTLAYLLSMQRRVFFGKIRDGLENIREAGPGYAIPAIILSLITIAAGILFPYLFDKALMPISKALF